jgi:protein CpxP
MNMKSQILEYSKNNFGFMSKKLIIAALLVISVSSFAQEQTKSEEKSNKPKREKQTTEQRSEAQLDKLTKELSLNPQQQEQIKPILAEQNAKMEAFRAERMGSSPKDMSADERDAFRAKRQEDKKATDAKLQAILTPEQFKKMKDIEKANMEKMREGRGNGNWGNRDNGGDSDNGGNDGNRDEN